MISKCISKPLYFKNKSYIPKLFFYNHNCPDINLSISSPESKDFAVLFSSIQLLEPRIFQ